MGLGRAGSERRSLAQRVAGHFEKPLVAAYALTEKQQRYAKIEEMQERRRSRRLPAKAKPNTPRPGRHDDFFNLEYGWCASGSSRAHPRIDGRDTKTVRPIKIAPACCRVPTARRCSPAARRRRWWSPRSAPAAMRRSSTASTGERKEPFMLHYNFPPFSVGETGMMGSPKRREIGHGNLAKRGVKAVMPDIEKFPYVIRVVSEIPSPTARAPWPPCAAPASR